MSGLMFAGMALGGIHIANAQNNVNQEIDNSRYTVVIPSEVNIDKTTGKGSFAVTGKVKAQSTIDVSIQSKNGYKLKNKSKELPYSLDKKSFSFDNSKSVSDLDINEVFNISSDTNTNFSGSYEDNLVFDITGNKYTYKLDANSLLDGKVEFASHNYGSFDVYINGQKVADDVSDFNRNYPYGTEYEFKDLKGTVGHHYSGVGTYGAHWKEAPLKGRLGIDAMYYKTDDSPYLLAIPFYFKFDTNKLTINYHADGAQTWKTANVNNASEIDVTGKDIMETEALKYDELYDEDAEKQHFCSVARIKRDGYTTKSNVWKVGQNDSLEVQDDKILQKAQNIAEYCGVLDEFKKNDTTIDLYPIWIPNTYTLTYDLNGGSFNASTTQLFKYGSGDAISSEIPNKSGYDFVGWKWGDVTMQPGDTIPKGWGNFTLTAHWTKKSYSTGTTLNIEGAQYIVIEQKEDDKYLVIRKESIGDRAFQSSTRIDSQNKNTYEDSEIDNYLENDWYNSLSTSMKVAIEPTDIKQSSYSNFNDFNSKQETGYNGQIYNIIKRHVFLPSVNEIENVVDLNKSFSIYSFVGHNKNMWTRDSIQNSNEKIEAFYGNYRVSGATTYKSNAKAGVRPAFVIDLSKIDHSVTGTVHYK